MRLNHGWAAQQLGSAAAGSAVPRQCGSSRLSSTAAWRLASFRPGARPFPGIGRGGWGQHPSGSQVSLVAGARTSITSRDCDLRGGRPLSNVPASPFPPHAHVLTQARSFGSRLCSSCHSMPRLAATTVVVGRPGCSRERTGGTMVSEPSLLHLIVSSPFAFNT